jgi:hypothetical protein
MQRGEGLGEHGGRSGTAVDEAQQPISRVNKRRDGHAETVPRGRRPGHPANEGSLPADAGFRDGTLGS